MSQMMNVERVEVSLKKEMVATLCFELRTYMTNIIGFAELMYEGEAGPISAEQKKCVGSILSSSKEMLQIIVELGDFAERETAGVKIENEFFAALYFELRMILNDIIEFSGFLYRGQAGTLSMEQQVYLFNIMSGSRNIMELISNEE